MDDSQWTRSPEPANAAAAAPAYDRGAAAHRPGLDPYYDWAWATRWRGYRRLTGALGTGGESIDELRVLVRAPRTKKLDDTALLALMQDARWCVAPVYHEPIPGTRRLARSFTATVPRAHWDWLVGCPQGILWELALPVRDAETAARAISLGMSGPMRAADAFRPTGPLHFGDLAALRSPAKKAPPKPTEAIAVIDFGCPFMHPAFADRSGRTTRVVALWDQGSEHGAGSLDAPWADGRPRLGYGRVLHGAALDAITRRVRGDAGRALDEGEAYRHLDYLIDYDDARRRIWKATHGSHVADVAAGAFDPLRARDLDPPEPGADPAGEAPIVFVQLPSLTGADCAGGSLGAQVLDALRFILDRCADRARVVVNLSYGSFAGPHDGSSMIEQAMDELVAACGGRLVIVLGAGNGREAACHVRRTVRRNRSALLRVGLDAGDFTDTFVEMWFRRARPRALAALRLRVRTGDGDWSPPIGLGQRVQLNARGGDSRPLALLRFDRQVPLGRGALALLCLAPTARPADDDGGLAVPGPWEVELFFDDAAAAADELAFDAWVERDDPGWLGHGVQPRFLEQIDGDADQTLSSLATGALTVAVGGFRRSSLAPVPYSATGSRAGPPLVYALCEEDDGHRSIRAAAVAGSDSLRMNGTSVAAPVFARRAYNWLVRAKGLPPGRTPRARLDALIDGVVEAERRGAGLVRRPPGR